MKFYEKIRNLSRKYKILIVILTTFLIAVFNFLLYNYQVLKLPANKRYYKIDLGEVSSTGFTEKDGKLYSTSKNPTISLNLESNYIGKIVIHYEAKERFEVLYTGEYANYYGLMKEDQREDRCHSELGVCGVSFHQKLGNINLNFNSDNIVITGIEVKSNFNFNMNTFIFWSIGVNLLVILFLESAFFVDKKHYLTFMLCIGFGIIFLTCTSNMTSTTLDDDSHYKNAGSLIQSSDKISIADDYLQNYRISFFSQETSEEKQAFHKFIDRNSDKFIDYPTSKRNLFQPNSINYLPEGITMKVLHDLGVKTSGCYFAARVVNLLIYSLVISFAVKLIPVKKTLLMIIGILPQALFLASNFNYDPTVIAFTLLSFAAFLDEYHNKARKIKLSNVLIFVLAGIYGVFPKAIYAPILLLMLLLPKSKFESKKQYRIFRMLIVGVFIVACAAYVIPMFTNPASLSDTRGGDVSATRQIVMMAKAPLAFIKTFWNSAMLNTCEKMFSATTIGQLSYYGVMGFDTSYCLIIIALVLAFVDHHKVKTIEWKHRLFMGILYFVTISSIWGSLYLGFTPVGEDVINGVQNRYFIPLILPIMYIFSTNKLKCDLKPSTTMLICVTCCILANLLLIYQVIIKFYCL